MKNLVIVLAGVTIFLINIAYGTECVHTHDTTNVSHQFYDALIETPKDAIVKGAVATKDLSKEVASAVVSSHAAHNLKEAAKELVIEAPVKTAYAIKNGTVKAFDATKEGAKVVYNVAVRRPAHAIKNAAHDVVQSDFVQGTKEAFVEIGEQIAEAGHDAVDATKYGAHKVYHVVIEKPVGAVKAAAHYLANSDDEEAHVTCVDCETCVMILPAPFMTAKSLESMNDGTNRVLVPNLTTIAVMPMSWVNGSIQTVSAENLKPIQEEIDIEFLMDTPCQLTEGSYSLSEKTIHKLIESYQAVQADLLNQK